MGSSQAQTPPAGGGWLKVAKDVAAGTCGGISVTLVGHPFDTLKVRLQTQSQTKPLYCESNRHALPLLDGAHEKAQEEAYGRWRERVVV